MPDRFTGTVAKWLNHKGIGFITPDEDTADVEGDVLVHYMQIKQETEDGFKSLDAGAKVEYELESDPKNPEKKVAVNVTGPGGEACKPKTKGSGRGGKGKGKGKGRKGKGKKGSEEAEEE